MQFVFVCLCVCVICVLAAIFVLVCVCVCLCGKKMHLGDISHHELISVDAYNIPTCNVT
jgi:hypothetical protein